MRARLAISTAALWVALLCSGPVRAQSPTTRGPALLAQAQEALEALRYEDAAELLDRAWRAGGIDTAELALLFRLTGEVAVTLGQDARAELAFQRLLALRPGAALPDGTSPKIAARMEAARAALGGRGLRVEIQQRGPRVAAGVVADPLAMIASVRVRGPGAGAPGRIARRDPASDSLLVELPPAAGTRVDVEILDQHGNILLAEPLAIGIRDGQADALPGASAAAPPPPASSRPRARIDLTMAPDRDAPPLLARGLTWTAAAAGLGAAGVFFGLRSHSAQNRLDELNRTSADHDFRDARAVEDRLRRDTLIADVAFAATGAAAVIAAVLWVRERRTARARRAASALRPADAAGLAWTIEF
jgi:hypothetical protein